MNRGFRGLLLTLITLLVFCSPLSPQAHSKAQQPKLVVLLVVDQMRGDYVDHFHEQWTGGLARLVNQGAWFRHAAYPYLSTVTCAGHATISTGQLPKSHGIVANGWFDAVERKIVSCTADPNVTDSTYGGQAHGGDSAWRLEVPAFADELRDQGHGTTRVVSFSIKARAAIMLAGRKADAVAWHDDQTGLWSTSSAYGPAAFVASYVEAHTVATDYGKTWAPSSAEEFVYNVTPQNRRPPAGWTTSFPHVLRGSNSSTGPDAAFYTQWESSPYSATYLVGLAESAVDSLHLGQGSGTDLLAISFSSLDLIGHGLGPYSHEAQDTLFQLDRDLGQLFAHLDQTVGSGNYVVAFSADHGVAPIPEEGATQGLSGGRFSTKAVTDRVEQILDQRWGGSKHVAAMIEGDLWLAPGEYDRLRADRATLEEVVKTLSAMPGVARVFRSDELGEHLTAADPIERAASFSYYPGRSGDIIIALKPYWIYSDSPDGTTHGSAYEYDQHVPVLFYGWGVRHAAFGNAVSPLDIAPTLADFCGIRLHHSDGHSLAKTLGAGRAAVSSASPR